MQLMFSFQYLENFELDSCHLNFFFLLLFLLCKKLVSLVRQVEAK